MYILFFVIFLVVAYFVTKNKNFTDMLSGATAAQNYAQKASGMAPGQDPLAVLAGELGFEYKPLQKTGEKNEMQASGGRMSGTYEGFPVSLIMEFRARENKTLNVAVAFSYTYERDSRVVMTVKNESGKKFSIMPKSDGATGQSTGNPAFDEKFVCMGDISAISHELMDFAVKAGWMNIKLSANELTFVDDFYEQPYFKTLAGATAMRTAVHPIWGTSATQLRMNPERVKSLLGVLVKVAQSL